MSDLETATGELQQCLDACNKSLRAANSVAARNLLLAQAEIKSLLFEELKRIRDALLRTSKEEEDEITQRINTIKAKQRE